MLMYPYIDVFLFYGLISELCHTGSVRVKTRDELHPAGVRGPAGPLSGQPPGARGSPPCALHLPPLRPAAVNRSPATANHTAPASGRQNSCCCSSRVQAGIDGMSPLGSAKLRRRFPSATFQQKYFTNFVAPLPVLGHSGPVNVNLTFFCDPGVSHTGKACCKIC